MLSNQNPIEYNELRGVFLKCHLRAVLDHLGANTNYIRSLMVSNSIKFMQKMYF